MRVSPTKIEGVLMVEAQPIADDRGFFARLFCPIEMAAAGVAFAPQQTSLSRNTARHTLRGMHTTSVPEAKLVRCVRGRIYDVALDLRPDSGSYLQWAGFELDAECANALYLPPGVAHGFLTLEAGSDVLYQIDRIYTPGFDGGVRYDDPAFAIQWPAEPRVIHSRDRGYPLYDAAAQGQRFKTAGP
jgi:dTDP-4-dehydrorhamnose 3,5-epimerase